MICVTNTIDLHPQVITLGHSRTYKNGSGSIGTQTSMLCEVLIHLR